MQCRQGWTLGILWLVIMNAVLLFYFMNISLQMGQLLSAVHRLEDENNNAGLPPSTGTAAIEVDAAAEREAERERHFLAHHSSGEGYNAERAERAERRLQQALAELERLDPSRGERKKVFEKIWDNYEWGKEDRSGPGSTPEASKNARAIIEQVIRTYGLRTMLDAPCGTFTWMPLIDFEALNVTYVGVDIVQGNIDASRKKWQAKQPHVFQFYRADVVDGFDFVDSVVLQASQDYPTNRQDWSKGWDLVLTREFLQHIPHDAKKRVLRNFNRSGSRYLLLTHHPGSPNRDVPFGGYEAMDVMAPPFSMPKPLGQWHDVGGEELALYKLPLSIPFLE